MRATMLLLAALSAARLDPAKAHEYGQDAARIEGNWDLAIEPHAAPDDGVNGGEAHPDIAALADRTGPCAEFRVRASRRNGGAETKHIEKCD